MILKNSNTLRALLIPLRILRSISRQNKFRVFFNLFLMIISSLSEAITVLSITNVISQFQTKSTNEFELINTRITSISLLGYELNPIFIFILIVSFSSFFRIYTLWYSGKTAAKVGNEVSKNIFLKIIHWPYERHLQTNSGILIATLTQFSKSAVGSINNFLTIINSLLIALALSISLLKVNGKISILLILILIFSYSINNSILRNRIKSNSETMKRETLNTFKIVKESLEGIKDVIINDRRIEEIKYFQSKDKILKNTVVYAKFTSTYPKYLFESLLIIGLLLIIYFLNNEENSINNLSQLSIFAFGGQKLLPSIQQIYASVTAIKHLESKTDSLLEILEENFSKSYTSTNQFNYKYPRARKRLFKDELELNSISFKYQNSESYSIKDFNLTLKRGDFIAIMGPSGAGKSTIIDAIMGLIKPQSGYIKVDGKFIYKDKTFFNLKEWQQSITHVPQNVYLLDKTIKQNILLNDKYNKFSEKRLREVCKVACLDEVIDKLPYGIETVVGERGNLLSGGQIQRIGIARAILNKSPLIILDEATSALDKNVEEIILKNIKKYCSESALIMITHKKESASICSRIIEIKKNID
ncbi:ABC transporter ATP-binding protein [uncultured Prochlorococcus sp.]|uniref:ATP-binding cassette domain-containing protein n=1 Tax=uncultured Prochlorococcus sp. TaxID=159733 RepID=UPI0025880F93|nr:ABC transporter ATP-binding protein [uncultured Prochlorococcus sp.]